MIEIRRIRFAPDEGLLLNKLSIVSLMPFSTTNAHWKSRLPITSLVMSLRIWTIFKRIISRMVGISGDDQGRSNYRYRCDPPNGNGHLRTQTFVVSRRVSWSRTWLSYATELLDIAREMDIKRFVLRLRPCIKYAPMNSINEWGFMKFHVMIQLTKMISRWK